MTAQERLTELNRLSDFFNETSLPSVPVKINDFMTLHNLKTFIATNLQRGNSDVDKVFSETCILRLQQLENYIIGGQSQ